MLRSNLVKSPSTTRVLRYEINKVGSLVDRNVVIANEKSRELKEKIIECYDKIAKEFRLIAEEYRKCANKSVNGDSICFSLKILANNCENQAKYTINRKREIHKLYTEDKIETSINAINDSINGINS